MTFIIFDIHLDSNTCICCIIYHIFDMLVICRVICTVMDKQPLRTSVYVLSDFPREPFVQLRNSGIARTLSEDVFQSRIELLGLIHVRAQMILGRSDDHISARIIQAEIYSGISAFARTDEDELFDSLFLYDFIYQREYAALDIEVAVSAQVIVAARHKIVLYIKPVGRDSVQRAHVVITRFRSVIGLEADHKDLTVLLLRLQQNVVYLLSFRLVCLLFLRQDVLRVHSVFYTQVILYQFHMIFFPFFVMQPCPWR